MNSNNNLIQKRNYEIAYYLTNILFKTYGKKEKFKDDNYSLYVFKNNIIYCKATNLLENDDINQDTTCNNNINFDLKIKIYEDISIDYSIKKNKKCKYCSINDCEFRLNCCQKPVHSECALLNNFNCDCDCNKNKKNETIDLIEKEISKCSILPDKSCMVCYDECNTITPCNHTLCNSCFDCLHKHQGNNIKCPYCRKSLIKINEPEIYNINLGYKKNFKVRFTYQRK